MFIEQIIIFKEGIFVRRTDTNFPEIVLLNRYIEQIGNFQEGYTDISATDLDGYFQKERIIESCRILSST